MKTKTRHINSIYVKRRQRFVFTVKKSEIANPKFIEVDNFHKHNI